MVDFEAINAAQWENDTDVGSVRSASPPAQAVQAPAATNNSGLLSVPVVGNNDLSRSSPALPAGPAEVEGQLYRARQDFRPRRDASEISIVKGAVILVIDKNGPNGRWLVKTSRNEIGRVPSEYLQEVVPPRYVSVSRVSRGTGSSDLARHGGGGPSSSTTNRNSPLRGSFVPQNSRQGNVGWMLRESSGGRSNAATPTAYGGQQSGNSRPSSGTNLRSGINGNFSNRMRDMVVRGHDSSNGREPRATGKDRFPKVPGAIPRRQQEALKNKKAEKALENKYLGKPPDGEICTMIGDYWLEPGFEAFEFFGDNLEELNMIRQKYHVFIEWESPKHCLHFQSHYEENYNEIIMAIRIRINELEGGIGGSAQYHVHPPSAETYKHDVVASTRPTISGKPPMLYNMRVTGKALEGAEREVYDNFTYPDLVSSNKDRYYKSLKAQLNAARSLHSWMRMRLQFGTVELKQYDPAFCKGAMPFEDFCKMMKTNKLIGQFEPKMGGLTQADRLISRIIQTNSLFCVASSSSFSEAKDVQPEYAFSVVVKNANDRQVRLEVEVDDTYGHQVGGVKCFENVRDTKYMDISTTFLDEEFDTNHNISVNTVLTKPEPEMKSLIAKITQAKLDMKADSEGNRYPRLSFLRDHFRPGQGHEPLDGNLIIEHVILRSSWVYAITDSRYEVEVCVYRKWMGHKTSCDAYETYLGVSVHNPDWDQLMESKPIGEDHDWELRDFFPSDAGEEAGFSHFLTKVEEILRILS